MKKILFISFLLMLSFITRAQSVVSESDSLPGLLKQAKSTNKLVFILLLPSGGPGLPLVKETFASADLDLFFHENFINHHVIMGSKEFSRIQERFPGNNFFPSYLYVDGNGNPVFRPSGFSQDHQRYIADARQALDKVKNGKTISWYQSEISQGRSNTALIRDYILENKKMGIQDNHLLIEEYVKLRPTGNVNSPAEALFILDAPPLPGSKAFDLVYSDKKLIEDLERTLPEPQRLVLQFKILNNSLNLAIKQKDISLAQETASYAAITVKGDPERSYADLMLFYYKSVNDTANYLPGLVKFIDKYNMGSDIKEMLKINADSIRSDAIRVAKDLLRSGDIGKAMAVNVPPANSAKATELNNSAWNIYLTGSKDLLYLDKAMYWTNRAIELYPTPAFYDTLAHILYRLQLYEEAQNVQKSAIRFGEERKGNTASMKSELIKMQERTL